MSTFYIMCTLFSICLLLVTHHLMLYDAMHKAHISTKKKYLTENKTFNKFSASPSLILNSKSFFSTHVRTQHVVTSLETQVVCDDGACCDGIYINRSCAWTNLYFYNKHFYALVLKNTSVSYDQHAVASNIRQFPQQQHVCPVFFPIVKVFESAEALGTFASNFVPRLQAKHGIPIVMSGGAHANPGHAILDEVYSAWLCVCKFGLENAPHLIAISLDTGLTESANPTHVEVTRAFLGDMQFVKHWRPEAAYRFDLVLAGLGQMGLSTPGTDYVMPGRKYDALKKMRTRFYEAYWLPPPIARASARREGPFVVLIIPNRRESHGVLSPDTVPLLNAAGFKGSYLDFQQLSFSDRLPLYRTTDIMVTGVGTGAMNSLFLSDGTVIVNLGTTERSGSTSFQEEYFFAAMYWTRMVYPTYDQFRSMSPQVAVELVNTAKKVILDDFDSSPNASGLENFSPIGRAAAEYFSYDERAWGAFVGSYYPGGQFDLGCLNMAERLLCATGPWSNNQCANINYTYVRALRNTYGVCCTCP